MTPDFVARLGAACVVSMDYGATGQTLSVTVVPERLLETVTVLDKEGFLLEDVMATDLAEGFELTYHFSRIDGINRLVLRLIVPHGAPDAPSIAAVYPGADWHERECFDFYGINFVGHPNLHFLLLPEDSDVHPLVKGPKGRKRLADCLSQAYLEACGLAGPEEPKAASAQASKADRQDA